jgi:hypothetical protein
MITDINGNMFSNLGNNASVRTFGPKELFGSNLEIHVDYSNPRDIFSDTGGTINVSASGTTVINRVNDISGKNRHFYNYGSSPTTATTPTIAISGASVFSGNTLDTNKGKILRDPNTANAIGLQVPNSNYTIAPTSSLTLCTYVNVSSFSYGGGISNLFGINYAPYGAYPHVGIGQSNNTNFVIYLKAVQYTILTNMTQYYNSYRMYTLTLSGYNYSVYIDNNLISSGTVSSPATFYPLSLVGIYSLNNFLAVPGLYKIPFPVAESFLTREYASPEKISLLYEYFRRKYKN